MTTDALTKEERMAKSQTLRRDSHRLWLFGVGCSWFVVRGSWGIPRSGHAALAACLVGGAALLMAGCAGYKLGPTNEMRASGKSIQINPVVNSTMEPRLGSVFTQALRKELQRDGTYRLNTRGDGDIVVHTEIVRYSRREMAFQRQDTLTAQDYELNAFARVVATERVTGRRILDKEVRGRLIIRIGQDLVSAERQSMPLLAETLARSVSSLLVDGEW